MKKKILGRLLTMLLVAAMVFTLLPASAIAAAEWWGGDEYADDTATQATEDADNFIRVFHLDCGRKYFSVAQIEEFIDLISKQNYTHMELAVGNDGLRFLLDDMSLTVNGKDYTSKQVSDAIHAGNAGYYSSEVYELTEDDMNAIFSYAKEKNIKIIPLLNTPGHMDAILSAATSLTGVNCSYNGSASTINVENTTAVAFTKAVLQKYIDYFAGKGCEYFNMGADEYANDIYTSGSLGFGNLIGAKKYGAYITYVNEVAAMIKAARMKPMAFNDGIYFQSNTSYGTFDTDIIVCYWSAGYGSYNVAPASTLASFGHKILNTHERWYYVLGNNNSSYNYSTATSGVNTVAPTTVNGSSGVTPIGCMQCFWCDTPSYSYNSTEQNRIQTLITTFSNNNPSIFKETTPVEPGIVITPSEGGSTGTTLDSTTGTASVTLDAGEVVTWHWDTSLVNLMSADNTVNAYAVMDSLDARRVTVTPVLNANGTAAITAEKDGKTAATYTVKVTDGSEPDVLPENIINISIGDLDTRSQDGVNAVLTANTNPTCANAKIEYVNTPAGTTYEVGDKLGISGGTVEGVISNNSTNKFLKVDGSTITETSDIKEATIFVITESSNNAYTIQVKGSNNYLTIDSQSYIIYTSYWLATTTDAKTWTYNNDHFYQRKGNRNYYITTNSDVSTSENSASSLYARIEKTEPATSSTTITFTGLAAGTTYITVGDVTYQVNVSEKAPDGAMTSKSISLEYWITNFEVYKTKSKSEHTKSITTSTGGVLTDDGVAITELAPEEAYSFFSGTVTVYYWQAMRLDTKNQQTNEPGDDETADGTTLTHIRYHGGAWQYKTTDGVWHYFQSDDQFVAYYLQKTEVTTEVTTYVKDWGFKPGNDSDDNTKDGKVALSVAVVYPDGSVAPSEENILNATTIFNYWSGRDIGIVAPEINENYTISKITYTKSDGTVSGVTSKKWPDTSVPTWKKKDVSTDPENPIMWYDETVVWDEVNNAGTTPMLNAKKSDVAWDGASTGVLVLIYLKPVVKNTNLNIVYWNDADNIEIVNGQVVVKEGVTYTNSETGIKQANPPTADGYFTLDDAAYINNSDGKPQTFNKNIVTVPNVDAKYRSGIYKYVGAEIADNGKTLILHYDIDGTKLKLTYVIDFALPVNIPLSDLVDNATEVKSLSVLGIDIISGTKVVKTTHGELKYDTANKNIVFTPNAVFGTEKAWTVQFSIGYSGAATSKSITIGVVPASNVLYEENFLTKADGWTLDTKTSLDASTAQETQEAKETKSVFGYDNAYVTNNGNNVTGELGVWKTTKQLTTSTGTGALTTSFYGNAFDLIGNCDKDSGRVMILVSKGKAVAKIVIVDTRYSAGPIYQVPLAHIELDEDATYSVEVYASGAEAKASTQSSVASYRSFAANSANDAFADILAAKGLTMANVEYVDMSTASAATVNSIATYADTAISRPAGTHVEIDGFRVYRSTTDDVANNYPENEQKLTYKNIIDFMAGKTITAYVEDKVVENCKVSDYESIGGPENEIYLQPDQSISFNVPSVNSIQVSLRAVGNAVTTNVVAGEISSNTEMYYTITRTGGAFTISNTSTNGAMLAIGNAKLPNGANVLTLDDLDEDVVFASVRAAFAGSQPAEPEQPTFNPEINFTVRSIPVFRNKLVTLTITTSTDVTKLMVGSRELHPTNSWLVKMGWSKTYTYVMTDTIKKGDIASYEIVAYNADGATSTRIVNAK